MMIHNSSSTPFSSFIFSGSSSYNNKFAHRKSQHRPSKHVRESHIFASSRHTTETAAADETSQQTRAKSFCSGGICSCGRRRFIEATTSVLLPVSMSNASDNSVTLNKVHPPKPDWYEEYFAWAMDTTMNSYETEIADYKSMLFANLNGKADKVLEIGIGTGPNLKYYANDASLYVYGVDPNMKMEKYAKAAAVAAGLPATNFNFLQSVGEAIPLSDASVDAVVGTLVLCSVDDVNVTLSEIKRVLKPGGLYLFVEHVAAEDGSIIRIVQNILDPLQQALADGCHLTRETGKNILETGFSNVDIRTAFLSSLPHVYGIACK